MVIALLADIILEQCPSLGDVTEPVDQDTTPHFLQVYPIWTRFGLLFTPDVTDITTGWDKTERQVLADNQGRFTSSVFQYWKANRGV